jgi:hypothetical protein
MHHLSLGLCTTRRWGYAPPVAGAMHHLSLRLLLVNFICGSARCIFMSGPGSHPSKPANIKTELPINPDPSGEIYKFDIVPTMHRHQLDGKPTKEFGTRCLHNDARFIKMVIFSRHYQRIQYLFKALDNFQFFQVFPDHWEPRLDKTQT